EQAFLNNGHQVPAWEAEPNRAETSYLPIRRVDAGRLIPLIRGFLLSILGVALSLATGYADTRDTLCRDDSLVTPGFIRDKWNALGGSAGPLGCALSDERDVVDGDGRVRQFLHGQVVWSPTPRLIVAAYERAIGDGGSADVFVDGDVNGPFTYDF